MLSMKVFTGPLSVLLGYYCASSCMDVELLRSHYVLLVNLSNTMLWLLQNTYAEGYLYIAIKLYTYICIASINYLYTFIHIH